MTRSLSYDDRIKMARARRASALARPELGEARDNFERIATGITSAPIKQQDPETARLIAEFERERGT